jgi:hypothetical protein
MVINVILERSYLEKKPEFQLSANWQKWENRDILICYYFDMNEHNFLLFPGI